MKKKEKKESPVPVSVVIPMRNAATTVGETLKTIVQQKYPIREIIVVDNVSKDNSRDIVRAFAKKSPIKVRLLVQKKDKGVASSYNWGVKEAISSLVVFLTSDCSLPTSRELEKLVRPMISDPTIVATYATSVLPSHVWNMYNFWQKYWACRMVDNTSSMMVLKFDCIRRKTFLEIGGFDDVNFGGDDAIGGEDADLSNRLRSVGKVVRTDARCLHVHYRGNDYSIVHLLKSRKMYARSQGRFLRKSAFLDLHGTFLFLIRPTLAILPFVPGLNLVGVTLLALYSFAYSKKMYIASSTLFDRRIFLIPFLNIFFLYYEFIWLLTAFFSFQKRYTDRLIN